MGVRLSIPGLALLSAIFGLAPCAHAMPRDDLAESFISVLVKWPGDGAVIAASIQDGRWNGVFDGGSRLLRSGALTANPAWGRENPDFYRCMGHLVIALAYIRSGQPHLAGGSIRSAHSTLRAAEERQHKSTDDSTEEFSRPAVELFHIFGHLELALNHDDEALNAFRCVTRSGIDAHVRATAHRKMAAIYEAKQEPRLARQEIRRADELSLGVVNTAYYDTHTQVKRFSQYGRAVTRPEPAGPRGDLPAARPTSYATPAPAFLPESPGTRDWHIDLQPPPPESPRYPIGHDAVGQDQLALDLLRRRFGRNSNGSERILSVSPGSSQPGTRTPASTADGAARGPYAANQVVSRSAQALISAMALESEARVDQGYDRDSKFQRALESYQRIIDGFPGSVEARAAAVNSQQIRRHLQGLTTYAPR